MAGLHASGNPRKIWKKMCLHSDQNRHLSFESACKCFCLGPTLTSLQLWKMHSTCRGFSTHQTLTNLPIPKVCHHDADALSRRNPVRSCITSYRRVNHSADGSTSSAGAGGLHIGAVEEYQKELELHVRQVLEFSTLEVFPLDLETWFFAAPMPGTSVDDYKQRMIGLTIT